MERGKKNLPTLCWCKKSVKNRKMSDWSGSRYEGPKENGWYQGKGVFYFPNGVKYDGEFVKGEFHGEGTLIYPNGVSSC